VPNRNRIAHHHAEDGLFDGTPVFDGTTPALYEQLEQLFYRPPPTTSRSEAQSRQGRFGENPIFPSACPSSACGS
jgi:hypothetical protein